jgi:tricorn protease interacting factor F2/3
MGDMTPIHYKIHLEPDLERFRFEGAVEILLKADQPVREIPLNALDLAVWTCELVTEPQREMCLFTVDGKKEVLRVMLPDERTGLISLAIRYTGEINSKMAGFYRTKYLVAGKERYAAVTQFEESDARRAFPCFDHPAMKATFDVEMVLDKSLAAISNTPVQEKRTRDDGRVSIRFERTPKMSTYLLFFGVGEFAFTEDAGRVLLRVVTTPGMEKQARFALAFARKSLEFSEDYYGIPYPLSKLDLIAVADFAAGAMENWGAITFRENLLLHDPEVTSKAGEERICVVIAHEVAHQWFGNLVTPSDWRYLWLNESFATYFGYGVVDHIYPQWDLWHQFLHGQTEVALDRDALRETFPIEIPGGEHVVINVSTAPIIYNKGGSLLRDIEAYVGKENFQKGLHRYLAKHAYENASSHHLWESLEEVSAKPVSRIMKRWIEQPGFPLVHVQREDDRLVVSQERFTYISHESSQEWLIPLAVRVFNARGESKTVTTLLEGRSKAVEIGADVAAYKINPGQSGFYRVQYHDLTNWQELGNRVRDKSLGPEDRWGLQHDLYALVKKGDSTLDDYLAFLDHYGEEDAFLPLISIGANLYHAYLVMDDGKREKISWVGRSLFERVLSSISYEPRAGETHATSILREQCMWYAVVYGSRAASEFGQRRFHALLEGEKVHPDTMKSLFQVGAFFGEGDTFDWFTNRANASESEHERMNILMALGCFKDKALTERAQQYVLDDVPDRNKFVPIGVMAENPYAMPSMWPWYVSARKRLELLPPVHYERILAAVIPWGGLGRQEEVKAFFEAYPLKEGGVVSLSLEKLEINERMRTGSVPRHDET